MNKEEMFLDELELISDEELSESLLKIIEMLPDYWFVEAASSTGKYHPSYALGEGGLLRHSKAAMRIGYELLSDPCIGDKYKNWEKDMHIVLSSLITCQLMIIKLFSVCALIIISFYISSAPTLRTKHNRSIWLCFRVQRFVFFLFIDEQQFNE